MDHGEKALLHNSSFHQGTALTQQISENESPPLSRPSAVPAITRSQPPLPSGPAVHSTLRRSPLARDARNVASRVLPAHAMNTKQEQQRIVPHRAPGHTAITVRTVHLPKGRLARHVRAFPIGRLPRGGRDSQSQLSSLPRGSPLKPGRRCGPR